jgi:hypothetical protein
MGTLVQITVFEKDENKGELSIQNTFNEIERLEGLINTHTPGSEVYSIRPQVSNLYPYLPRCSRTSNRLYIGPAKQTVLWI